MEEAANLHSKGNAVQDAQKAGNLLHPSDFSGASENEGDVDGYFLPYYSSPIKISKAADKEKDRKKGKDNKNTKDWVVQNFSIVNGKSVTKADSVMREKIKVVDDQQVEKSIAVDAFKQGHEISKAAADKARACPSKVNKSTKDWVVQNFPNVNGKSVTIADSVIREKIEVVDDEQVEKSIAVDVFKQGNEPQRRRQTKQRHVLQKYLMSNR